MKWNFKNIFFITFLIGLIPAWPTNAKLLFSEVAWMGTTESANYEWIEIYNASYETIKLDGWAIVASDGSPAINLSGQINPNETVILERNESALPSITSHLIYSGALANQGEVLSIKDSNNNLIDIIDASLGWPAGDNDSKETMQRNQDKTWSTRAPTPKQTLLTQDESLMPDQNSNQINDKDEEAESNEEKETDDQASNKVSSTKMPDPEGVLDIPKQALVGNSFLIQARLHSKNNSSFEYGHLIINFGDGNYTETTDLKSPIYYQYSTAGEYLISYELRANPWSLEAVKKGEEIITVYEEVFLAEVDGTHLRLKLADNIEGWDLSGWQVNIDNGFYTKKLPPLTKLIQSHPVIKITIPTIKNILTITDTQGQIRFEYHQSPSSSLPTINLQTTEKTASIISLVTLAETSTKPETNPKKDDNQIPTIKTIAKNESPFLTEKESSLALVSESNDSINTKNYKWLVFWLATIIIFITWLPWVINRLSALYLQGGQLQKKQDPSADQYQLFP